MVMKVPVRLLAVALLLGSACSASAQTKNFPERRPLCLGCHGAHGVSSTPDTPSLGGLPELYALLQLAAFRDGNRRSDIMEEVLKDMTDDDLRAAADMVGKFPRPAAPKQGGDPARMKRGAELAVANRCNQCHGARFTGGEQMPPLRNQREDYLLKTMHDFKAERRLGDRAIMVEILSPLGDADLAALAHYLAHVRD